MRAIAAFLLLSLPVSAKLAKSNVQVDEELTGLAAVYSKRLKKEDFRAYNMPDDCDKPFQDEEAHAKFYESAISSMAINRGAGGTGVVPLFAVAELKYRFQEMFPNLADESPIDRLLVAQVCKFREIRAQNLKPGAAKSGVISSFDTELHEHLAVISDKLYKDSRSLLIEAKKIRTSISDEELRYRERWAEVLKARRRARDEVRDFVD